MSVSCLGSIYFKRKKFLIYCYILQKVFPEILRRHNTDIFVITNGSLHLWCPIEPLRTGEEYILLGNLIRAGDCVMHTKTAYLAAFMVPKKARVHSINTGKKEQLYTYHFYLLLFGKVVRCSVNMAIFGALLTDRFTTFPTSN